MKNINIIIPTRNRWEKLQRCLRSISFETPDITMNLTIVCDGDRETALKLMLSNNDLITQVVYVKRHSGSVYCRNLVTQTVEDALIYATDDMEFLEGSIDAAINSMREHFPDDDGVIGFNVVNGGKFSPTAFALVGQKFLKRYPNRKLFDPEYSHFSCQEINYLGDKLGKLHLEVEAKINHYHPSKFREERDETHDVARINHVRDREITQERRSKSLIWGDSEK